ncbi:DUF1801 domain-containing protein [uncultured Sneathiella sp.]|uniref:DUF1801 domain-containing protein n=1 Tax=uncultured Sneathiella sp. TaxID=879315 RepID=UPI0030DD8F88|tara:strand:+ start:186 stop:599 length:414 start_codon:yes stop_codon:yes gene_type:complete
MSKPNTPKLLSNGNPQIPKGDGNAPVQTYISAMPGWKSDVGRRLDAVVDKAFPEVQKAVKWNTPLYGKADGWFIAMYCYKKYVQLTFMNGDSLAPVPPKASKVEGTRYLDIYEEDELDEDQIMDWITQASKLPGTRF